jgi:hypothetical protein
MRDSNYNIYFKDGDPQLDLLSSVFKGFKSYLKDKPVKIVVLDETLENSPDLISYLYYGTESYWWIICDVNNISDPSTELPRGKQIAIPRLSDISSYLQFKNSKNNSSSTNIVTL